MRSSWLIWGALGWAFACGDDGAGPPNVGADGGGSDGDSPSSPDGTTNNSSNEDGGAASHPDSSNVTTSTNTPHGSSGGGSTDEASADQTDVDGATSTSGAQGSGGDGGDSTPPSGTSEPGTSMPTCVDDCELDSIECAGEGQDIVVQRCVVDDATECTVWAQVPGCDAGACVPSLVDDGCDPSDGTAVCGAEGLVVCAPSPASGCPVWQIPTEAMRTRGDVEIDDSATEFTGYGALSLQLTSDASALVVCLTDTRPAANVADAPEVLEMDARGNGEYGLVLSRYQLPIAYELTVALGSPPSVRTTVLAPDVRSRVAFITDARGNGDIASWPSSTSDDPLIAADEVCTSEANSAGLDGEYRAFLSVETQVDAICRLRGGDGLLLEGCGLSEQLGEADLSAPFLNMRGLPIAYGTADLEAGLWRLPVGFSSTGAAVSRSVTAWTGSDATGVVADADCAGWSTSDDGIRGSSAGSPAVSAPAGAYSSKCNGQKALLCFSAGDGHPLEANHERSGKAAFVIETGLNASVDLSTADAACQSAFGSDDVLAWFSDEENDALCRLAGLSGKVTENCGQAELPLVAGPWVRADGYLVGADSNDLLDGLLAPITLGPDGSFAPYDGTQELVRTDTQEYGGRGIVTPATSCVSGDRMTVGSEWTYVAGTCPTNVDFRSFVYCFER